MGKDKKRKRQDGEDKTQTTPATNGRQDNHVDTSKPSASFEPQGSRDYTLSLALPGSIVANAKSHDQKTFLAGTVARALAVFCVDEIIIFDDDRPSQSEGSPDEDVPPTQYTAFSHPSHFLAHVLSYLETPPHLRKALFPMHPNLRTAGTLPSLDMPHHPRSEARPRYSEGVTTSTTANGTYVDVGLTNQILLNDVQIPANTRVTVDMNMNAPVLPSAPREKDGYYWGYVVRRCPSISTVLTECPYDGGYDLSFGTSERGKPLSSILSGSSSIPRFNHMLIVLGGVAGLETAAKNDPELAKMGIQSANVGDLFDHWVNVLPGQGSRTIRTEEAAWLALMALRPVVEGNETD